MNNIEKIICLLLIFLIIKNKINLNILTIIYFIIIVDIIIEQRKKCNESFSSNHIDYTPLKKKLLENDLISLSCENCNESLDNTKYFLTFSKVGTKYLPILQKEIDILKDMNNYKNELNENIKKCNLEESIKNVQNNIVEEEEERYISIKNYPKCEYITRHKSHFKLINTQENIYTLYGASEGDKANNNYSLSEILGISSLIEKEIENITPKVYNNFDGNFNSNIYLKIISHDNENKIYMDGTIEKPIEKNNKLNFIDNSNLKNIYIIVQ